MNTMEAWSAHGATLSGRPLMGMPDANCRPYSTHARLDIQQFEAMCHAFRPHGAFVTGDEAVRMLRGISDRPLSTLARWIVSRSVLNISWQGESLIPMFQFNAFDMSMRPSCACAVAELKDVFDDWELALWFAAPNSWLDYAAPVAMLDDEGVAVLQAARADRFIARG